MTPYYESDGITIYHGDCREILAVMPVSFVDVLITDPPYGVKWQSGQRQKSFDLIVGDDSPAVGRSGITAGLLVLREMRHVYIFGRPDLSGLPLSKPAELIWDKGKMGGGDLRSPWGPQHEYIQFAIKTPYRSQVEGGRGGLLARRRHGSILRYDRPNGRGVTRHPTEKPVPLFRQLIESSSHHCELVLDPFCGVGGCMVAALVEGRRGIGIEIEERYCETTAKRLSQVVLNFGEPAA